MRESGLDEVKGHADDVGDHKHLEGDMYNEFQNIKQSKLLRPFRTEEVSLVMYQKLELFFDRLGTKYQATFFPLRRKTFYLVKNYNVSHNTSLHRALRKFIGDVKFYNEAHCTHSCNESRGMEKKHKIMR